LRIIEGYVFYPSTAANVLAEDFMEFLYRMLPRLAALKPESSWAFEPSSLS
jgi:hypothetical protein